MPLSTGKTSFPLKKPADVNRKSLEADSSDDDVLVEGPIVVPILGEPLAQTAG